MIKTESAPPVEVSPSWEDAQTFNRRGLFIGGCPKSGTTLLLSLLDGHPELIALPEETFYLEDRRKFEAEEGYTARLKCLLQRTDLRWLAQGHFEPEKECDSTDARDYTHLDYQRFAQLAEKFVQQPWMNDSLLLSETIRAYAISLGVDWTRCVRWIEKSTSNEVRHEAMDTLYPDAKLIQLVRDPRAVFASRKKRKVHHNGLYTKAHRLVREWNRCAREIPRLRLNSEKYLVLRYEDLVRNSHPMLQKVCQFAGIEFVSALLTPTRAGGQWAGNSSFQESFKGINAKTIDQWKDYLTAHEIWWIELHCRKGMQLAGYEFQSDARFSLVRWLKRLPNESWVGYFRARRASLCQWLGLLKECNYPR